MRTCSGTSSGRGARGARHADVVGYWGQSRHDRDLVDQRMAVADSAFYESELLAGERQGPRAPAAAAFDSGLAAVENLITQLEHRETETFFKDHFQIIEVPVPAPKAHTIIGLRRRTPLGPAEAFCSCGWSVESTGQNYVGQKVAEHLADSRHPGLEDVKKWSQRANLDFTGHSA